jgi:O-antigen ligase
LQAAIGAPADSFLIPEDRVFYGDIQLTAGTDQFWEPGQRVSAFMGRYDQLGTFLCLVLLIAVGLIYYNPEFIRKKYVKWLIFILGFPALILTYSRASWFGFLGAFLFIAIFLRKDRRVLIAFVILVALLSSYLLYSGIAVRYLTDVPGQTISERFFEAFSLARWRGEYYYFGRLYFFVNTLTTVLPAYPVFGAGPGQYGGGAVAALHNTTVYDKLSLPFGVYGTEGYIDNNWFSLLGETGIVGFCAYVVAFVLLLVYNLKVYKLTKDKFLRALSFACVGIILAVGFQALLGTYLEVRTLAFYFWLTSACVVSLAQKEKLKVL